MKLLTLAAASLLLSNAPAPDKLPPLFKVELPARFYEVLPKPETFEPPSTTPRYFPIDTNNRRLS